MNQRRILLLVIALTFILFNLSFAQPKGEDIVIGKSIKLQSKILNEEREIFISLPDGYETSKNKCPVLYVLDGDRIFDFSVGVVDFLSRGGRGMPEAIIVGIPNTNRRRDLSPNRDQSGGGDAFLKFLEEELMPFVDSNYRTSPYRILYGHSLAGMFSIYTLFAKPDLFNGYIAVSPYLMFDNGYVVDYSKKALEKKPSLNKSIYITLGNEPTYTDTVNIFLDLLKTKAPENLKWKYLYMEAEDHGSIPLKALYSGLEFIFSEWNLSYDTANKGVDAIKSHYAKLSKQYGYEVEVHEGQLNMLGYRFLGEEQYGKAISIFKLNVAEHPESANVYDSLGEAYEGIQQFELAKKNYEIACKKGTKDDPFLQAYKDHLENIQKVMTKKKQSSGN